MFNRINVVTTSMTSVISIGAADTLSRRGAASHFTPNRTNRINRINRINTKPMPELPTTRGTIAVDCNPIVHRPQLLVSVRNADEAAAALAGGCDVLDIKEPQHGSLGMAEVGQMRAILNLARSADPLLPVSAALGEATDWLLTESIPTVPAGLAYVKMGTAGLGAFEPWETRWKESQARFCEAMQLVEGSPPQWIVVAYADWQLAAAPHPATVLETAAEQGWGGLLIDTHSKQGRGLFEWIAPADIAALAERAAHLGVPFALAGSLSPIDVPHLLEISPDIVGIRTAACRGGVRQAPIDPFAVRSFKGALRAAQA